MKKKGFLFIALGLLAGIGISFAVPVIAKAQKQIFDQAVVFKKVIDAREGIKNKKGAVKVKDNLVVTGNLNVEGETNLAVSASNITLNNDASTASIASFTESENLQDALDNEIAIDFASLLPGTTWTVTNVSEEDDYTGTTGQITFSEDGASFSLDSGRMAPGGLVDADEDSSCNAPTGDISYTLYNNQVLYITWSPETGGTSSTALQLFGNSTESIGLLGSGGCGNVGGERFATLTRVQ